MRYFGTVTTLTVLSLLLTSRELCEWLVCYIQQALLPFLV